MLRWQCVWEREQIGLFVTFQLTAGSLFLAGGPDLCQVTGGLWVRRPQQEVPHPSHVKNTPAATKRIFLASKYGHFKRHCVLLFCACACDCMYRVLSQGRVGSVALWNWTRCSLCSLPGFTLKPSGNKVAIL